MQWTLHLKRQKQRFLGRFPAGFDLHDLKTPIEIFKTQNDTFSSRGKKYKIREEANVWVVEDSSTDSKLKERFVGTNEDESSSEKYFLLLECKENMIELLPIESLFLFNSFTPTSSTSESLDFVERQEKLRAIQEATVSARVKNFVRHDSDDERNPKLNKGSDNEDSDMYDEDFGIRRQEEKRRKIVRRSRQANIGKQDDYVDSALSLRTLRQAHSSWDFEEGTRSDDEDDTLPAQQIHGDLDIEDDQIKQDDDSGTFDSLTSYGQTVVSLLNQQEKQEVDDELNQYSDDEEENEPSHTPETPNSSFRATTGETKSLSVSPDPMHPTRHIHNFSASVSGAGKPLSKEEVRLKIIRILTQNMGRLNVKDLMSFFKFKGKNEEFCMIQEVIQQVCSKQTVEISGRKVNFIVLKPEFRQ